MILTYHKISTKSRDENTVSIMKFLFQMLYIKIKGYNVVTLDEYIKNHKNNDVVIRFDDGHRSVLKYAYPILRWLNFPFEIFVCEDFINHKKGNQFLTKTDLENVANKNIHIQYHSKSHKDLTTIEDEENLECEIKCPKYIKDIDENGFKIFAYPYWKYNETIQNIVKKYYTAACSGNGYADGTLYALDGVKITDKYILLSDLLNPAVQGKIAETLVAVERERERERVISLLTLNTLSIAA